MNKLIAAICFIAFALAADTMDIISDADAPAGSGGFTYFASWFNRQAAILDNGDVLFIRKHDYTASSYAAVYRWSPDNTLSAVYNGYETLPFVGVVARPAWQVAAIDGTRAAVLLYNENKPAVATIGSTLKCSLVKDIISESSLQKAKLVASPEALRLYAAVPDCGVFTLTSDNDASSWTARSIQLQNIQMDTAMAATADGRLFFYSVAEDKTVWLSCYSPEDNATTSLFQIAESSNHTFAVAVSRDGTTVYFTADTTAGNPPALFKGTYDTDKHTFIANAVTLPLDNATAVACDADGGFAVFSSSISPLDGSDFGTPQIWLFDAVACSFSCLSQLPEAPETISCATPAISRNARVITFTAQGASRQQPQLCRVIRDLTVTVPTINAAPATAQAVTIRANHLGETALVKAAVTTGSLLYDGTPVQPSQAISFSDSLTLTFVAGADAANGTITVNVSEDNGATWHPTTADIIISDVIFEMLSVHEDGSILPAGQTSSFLSVACSDDTAITAFTTGAHLSSSDTNVSTNIYVRNAVLGTTTYRSDLGNAQFCAISPDGSTVIRSSLQGSALNFDGTVQKTQTLALSRDGALAVTFKAYDGLYLSRRNAPAECLLKTDVQPSHVAFSLSGNILYYCFNGHPYSLQLSTGTITALTETTCDDAIVSADGRYLFTLVKGVISRLDLQTKQSLHIYTAVHSEQTGIAAAAADGSSLVFVTTDAVLPEDVNQATDIIRAILPCDKEPIGFATITTQENTTAVHSLMRTCPQDLYLRNMAAPLHGTAVLTTSDDGWYAVDYTPAAHYWGEDAIAVQAWDGSRWQPVTIDITIDNVNDAPQWLKDSVEVTVAENKQTTLSLTAYAFDQDLLPPVVPGETLSFSLGSDAPQWASISADGVVRLNLTDIYGVATRDAAAVVTFAAIVTDAAGASAEMPVIVTVTNTDPVIKLSTIYADLQSGWNLVAYPVDLPTADYFTCAWSWNAATGRFEQADVLQADRGYFVFLDSVPEIEQDSTIVCDYTATSAAKPGWHLVGHRAGTAHWSLYLKDMTYQGISGALLPGKGYWKYIKP